MGQEANEEGPNAQACDANISKWEGEIEEYRAKIGNLTLKVEEEKVKKRGLNVEHVAAVQAEIDEETKIKLKYYGRAQAMEDGILKLIDSNQVLDTKIDHFKEVFAKLKSNLS
ncbi:hypothetical protein TSUD_134360 [Trifolium subterraneum]|uniref:Uncharacterized protein n=1 Tax=Trifolium subterraneum TaxID=3900 RepID=A0A2Z6P3C0_TRISU|nr:hypothetical protein TSUD_134360 [Trifolium subterraneum]